MCGIAGFFSDTPLSSNRLRAMGRLMQHRGPDGEGIVWLEEQKQVARASEFTPEDCIGEHFGWLPTERTVANGGICGGFVHRRLAIIAPDRNGYQPYVLPRTVLDNLQRRDL